MVLMPDEFKEYIENLTDTLLKKDIGFIKKSLNPWPGDDEKLKIIGACEYFLSVLIGDTTALGKFHKREEEKRKLRKKYGKEPMPKKDAITYTGWSKPSFERKVNDKENEVRKIIINGKPYFEIDDLDKIMRLIIDSSKSALCINSHYQFDRKREGFLPFRGGEYYKILDENEKTVWLYNERWKANVALRRIDFSAYFRVEEEIKF